MKRKITLLLIVLALALTTVSCFKKKDKEKDKTATEKQGEQPAALNLNNGITNLTPEEQKFLLDNSTDPLKVSEAIKKAEAGDKDAIMSLAQLYYGFNDKEKVKKYLQLGVAKNYPEAIYNLAMLYKEEGNTAEADKLMAMLPNGGAGIANQLQGASNIPPAAAEAYNKAVNLAKNKKFNEAKAEFEKAYNQGATEADIQIGVLNKEIKNYSEAIKWFKKAADRGVEAANFEVGALLFDTGKQVEARPYLIKAYNAGNKGLAMPIAMSYHKQNNMSEALKWYQIAAKNGDKDAQRIIAQAQNNRTRVQAQPSGNTRTATQGSSGTNSFLNENSGTQKKESSTGTLSGESLKIDTSKLKEKAVESKTAEAKASEEKKQSETKTPEAKKPEEKKETKSIDEIMNEKASLFNE